MKHIIYVPGLGDRYDPIRKLGLLLWRRRGVQVTHVAMRWLDPHETMAQKIERIHQAIKKYPGAETVVVGESAGGSAAIVVADRFPDEVAQIVTICGMNKGSANVSPRLYEKNRAFKEFMGVADRVVPALSNKAKQKMFIVYSSHDYTVRPKHSLIAGVESIDLKIPGHMVVILAVLFSRFRTIKYLT